MHTCQGLEAATGNPGFSFLSTKGDTLPTASPKLCNGRVRFPSPEDHLDFLPERLSSEASLTGSEHTAICPKGNCPSSEVGLSTFFLETSSTEVSPSTFFLETSSTEGDRSRKFLGFPSAEVDRSTFFVVGLLVGGNCSGFLLGRSPLSDNPSFSQEEKLRLFIDRSV